MQTSQLDHMQPVPACQLNKTLATPLNTQVPVHPPNYKGSLVPSAAEVLGLWCE